MICTMLETIFENSSKVRPNSTKSKLTQITTKALKKEYGLRGVNLLVSQLLVSKSANVYLEIPKY